MVALESAVLTVTGVLFGAVAALCTILPFNFARTDTVLPEGGPGIFLAIVDEVWNLPYAHKPGVAAGRGA